MKNIALISSKVELFYFKGVFILYSTYNVFMRSLLSSVVGIF